MILQLIRKDLLIAKKYVIILIVFIVGAQVLPLIVAVQPAVNLSSFLVGLVFGQLLFYTTLSQLDTRYPKATSLLCTAPYTRDDFVKARYAMVFLLFVFSYIVNVITNLALGQGTFLSPLLVLLSLLIDIVIFGIYIPLEYKYGYTKVRFIQMGVILVIAFLPQAMVRIYSGSVESGAYPELYSDINIPVRILMAIQSLPDVLLYVIMILVTAAVFFISIKTSMKIFNKKEL